MGTHPQQGRGQGKLIDIPYVSGCPSGNDRNSSRIGKKYQEVRNAKSEKVKKYASELQKAKKIPKSATTNLKDAEGE